MVKNEIENVMTGILRRSNEELFALTEEQLESRWFYKFDPDKSMAWNTYEFVSMLDLYRSSCRRWEEHHNGNCCVVERVRDKYLMPKIKQFNDDMAVFYVPKASPQA